MYKWTIGESIDAWKLNVMQNRRIMATLNEDGKPVVVTLSDVSPTDDGTWFKIPTDVLEQKPGSFGHVQLDYDNDCNRYKLATASPNITGFMENVRPEANTHKWTTKLEKDWVKDTSHHTMSMAEYMQCFNAWDAGSSLEPPPVWEWYPDKQKTDPDPTVLNENCVRLFATTLRQRKDEGSGYEECFLMLDMEGWKAENTRMFTPDSYDLGSITADPGTDGFYKKLHATVKNKKVGEEHVFEIANHDNIEIWPLARPKGMSKEEFKDLGTKAEGGNVQDGPAGTVPGQEGQTSDKGSAIDDFKNRLGKSHWSPLASRDVREGPLIPIMSIGEGGGTFVQHIKDNGTDTYSIAVGSGVEFYDDLTCAERNKKDPRPQSTKATTYLGHGASVTISNINKDKPWQFKLSSTPISITCDLGTTANAVPAYDLPDESYLTWGVVPDYGSESLRTGLMTGKVRRLTDGLICEGDSGEWHKCKQYAVGEIRDGVLGIRTATWRDPMGAGSSATNFAWNRQGGVVVGIVQDPGSCHYKPYIDKDGMIHVAEQKVNQRVIKETVTNNITSFVNGVGGGGYVPLNTASIDRTVKGSLVTNDMLLHAPLENKPGRTSYVWNYGDPEIDQDCYKTGILNGEVLGLTGGLICVDAKATTPARTYRVGEIECGKLGIAYSHYAWRQLPDPPTGSITGFPTDQLCYNPGGGLIRKIEWDSHCRQRPQIIDGIIKFPGKEWNTENQVVCASAQLYSGSGSGGATGGYPVYEWPVVNNDSWAKCGTELNTGGKVTGEVVVLKHRGEVSSIFEEASALSGHIYKSPELGEVYKGQIGISTAFFLPYMQPSLMEEEGQRELSTRVILDAIKDRDIEKYSYAWNAGVVRGVVSDINWNRYYYTKEMCYVGEESDGIGLNLPDCVYYVRFLPFIMPHIDRDGLIHLPKFDFIAEKHVFSCAGSSSQCIKFIGTKPYATSPFNDYMEPEDFPIVNPEDPGSEFEPPPTPPDIGSIVDYGTIIEDEE